MTEIKKIETHKVSPDFIKQLAGYGLATARILYHLPDHPRFLQTYIWQDYDLAPEFPMLLKFLTFWRAKLEWPTTTLCRGPSSFARQNVKNLSNIGNSGARS